MFQASFDLFSWFLSQTVRPLGALRQWGCQVKLSPVFGKKCILKIPPPPPRGTHGTLTRASNPLMGFLHSKHGCLRPLLTYLVGSYVIRYGRLERRGKGGTKSKIWHFFGEMCILDFWEFCPKPPPPPPKRHLETCTTQTPSTSAQTWRIWRRRIAVFACHLILGLRIFVCAT